jgi:flagellar biosynthesis protein FlhF
VPDLTELHQQFLTQEVQRDLAADLIDRIRRLPGYDPLLDTERLRIHAGAILQEMGLALPVDAGAHLSSRVVVLVGPSGVGKTTTAIKLAALQAVRPGRKVALMTLDDRRIGALDQLRIYSRLLEVPLAVATSPEDARQALNDFQALDGIIVDTPGISRGEENRLLELRRILEPLTSKEVHLVLNASTRERDLVRIIDAWKDLGVNRLAFTRLDEASTWGGLLNLLLRTRLPLSYLSTGPRIPDDLAEAPLELLIHRLWPAHAAPIERRDPVQPGLDAAESLSRKISAPFVANRNSDLYHRPECKWALKIKHGNLIQFASAQAAEARRFAPCRSCCPYEADGEAGRREGHRISSYR